MFPALVDASNFNQEARSCNGLSSSCRGDSEKACKNQERNLSCTRGMPAKGNEMKFTTGLLYAVHLCLTGGFFLISSHAFEYVIWTGAKTINDPNAKLGLPSITEFVSRLFSGYHSNYAFSDLAFLCWLIIVFVTLFFWWKDTSGLRMLIRVAVATWLVFLTYITAIVGILFALKAPFILLLSEDLGSARPFADTVRLIAGIAGYAALLLFGILVIRALWRIARPKKQE